MDFFFLVKSLLFGNLLPERREIEEADEMDQVDRTGGLLSKSRQTGSLQ